MLSFVFRFFWPDLTKQEIKKYGFLSLSIFFIIGIYSLLKPLTDGVFFHNIGPEF